MAIEKEKQSIVLWEVEESIALKTKEDKKWEEDLKTIATDLSFFNLYNYTPSMHRLNINVKSLYYVQSSEGGISISIYRFLKDRSIKPFRAFLLGEGYDIPFSKALAINDGRLNLSNSIIDKKNREDFIAHFNSLVKHHQENERIKKEYEEQQRRELSKKKPFEQQQTNERNRNGALEEKMKKQKGEEMQKNLNALLEKAKDYLANITFENYSEAQLWSKQSKLISDFQIAYMKGKYLNIDIDKFTLKMEQLIAEQFAAKQTLRKIKQQKLKEEMLAIVEKEFNKMSLDSLKKNYFANDPYISIPLFENMLTKLSNYAKKANWKFRVTDWIDRSDIGQCLINVINEREKTEGQELRRKLEKEQLEKNRPI